MKVDRKTLYLDVETTGLDPVKNGLIQLACLVDINGEVVEEKNWLIRPFETDVIDDKALEVNGRCKTELPGYPSPEVVYNEIIEFFETYVNKFIRTDKFWPVITAPSISASSMSSSKRMAMYISGVGRTGTLSTPCRLSASWPGGARSGCRTSSWALSASLTGSNSERRRMTRWRMSGPPGSWY